MLNSIKNPPRLIACIISFLFGAIGTLAFSPFDYWIIAFVSAFGLIWSATLSQRIVGNFCLVDWLFWHWRKLDSRQYDSIRRRACRD